MATKIVIDRIVGERVIPVTFASPQHAMLVMTNILYDEPDNSRAEYASRPAQPGEIAKLTQKCKALRKEGKTLPGWDIKWLP
jgi:hypothetical protein